MSASPIVKATLQAALINASSNVMAQAIAAYRTQFTASAMILAPLTYVWMNNLESTFPAYPDGDRDPKKTDEKTDDKTRQTFNVGNTIAKVVLDQTVGAALNTTMFLLTMGILRGQDSGAVMNSIRKDFWPIMFAGLKLWPLVSILCFTFVPPDKRLIVGSLFGFVWAIYLSMMSS